MKKQTKPTVAMFGPSLSDPSKVVNRDVPEMDVAAFQAAGYKVGSVEEPKKEVAAEAAPAAKTKKK